MKKIRRLLSISILSSAVLFQANAQKKKNFKISFNLHGLQDYTKAYLLTVNKDAVGNEMYNTKDTVGRTLVQNGAFVFEGIIHNDGQWFIVSIENEKAPLHLLLSEEQIKITGEMSNWPNIEINGSVGTKDMLQFRKEYDSLKGEERNDYWRKFVGLNSNSLYAAFLILKSFWTYEEKQAAYDKLSSYAKNSYWGTRIPGNIKELKLAELVKENAILPDFKINTSEGKSTSVLEYVKKGKLTLIDFWASWCHPCREETPNMKKVYNSFHNKGFNIIGVSTDAREADWKKALIEENTPWLHGRDNLENASKGIFSINAIPAFALVDREGKLIAFSCGMSNIPSFGPEIRGEGLYKTIEDLLKAKSN